MSLLDQFEKQAETEDNNVDEKDLKVYINEAIDKKILNANIGEIIKISKSKVLEMELIIKELEKQKEVVDIDREKSMTLLETIATELNNFNKTTKDNIDIFREELKLQNTLFAEEVEKSKILKIIEHQFSQEAQSLVYNVKQAIEKNTSELEKTIDILDNKVMSLNSIYIKLWFVVIALFIGVFGVSYYYNSKINHLETEFYELSNANRNIIDILLKDNKVWYSKKDKQLYLDSIEGIKKQKKAEK